jgi:hypothetical protein
MVPTDEGIQIDSSERQLSIVVQNQELKQMGRPQGVPDGAQCNLEQVVNMGSKLYSQT